MLYLHSRQVPSTGDFETFGKWDIAVRWTLEGWAFQAIRLPAKAVKPVASGFSLNTPSCFQHSAFLPPQTVPSQARRGKKSFLPDVVTALRFSVTMHKSLAQKWEGWAGRSYSCEQNHSKAGQDARCEGIQSRDWADDHVDCKPAFCHYDNWSSAKAYLGWWFLRGWPCLFGSVVRGCDKRGLPASRLSERESGHLYPLRFYVASNPCNSATLLPNSATCWRPRLPYIT